MKTPLTVAAVVAICGLVTQAHAAPSSMLLGSAGWEAFAETPAVASFAWAGENESFADSYDLVGKPLQGALIEDPSTPVCSPACPRPSRRPSSSPAWPSVACSADVRC
jgi:hypothetical protein